MWKQRSLWFKRGKYALHHGLTQFRQLPHEQQRQLSMGALIMGLVLLVFGVLKPSWDFAYGMRATALEEKALRQKMQASAGQIRAAVATQSQNESTHGDGSLLTLASSTSQQHQLVFQRYEPTADGKLSLWLSNAEFNHLLTWLDSIVTHEHVLVDRVSINQTAKPGLVDAQIVLRSETVRAPH